MRKPHAPLSAKPIALQRRLDRPLHRACGDGLGFGRGMAVHWRLRSERVRKGARVR